MCDPQQADDECSRQFIERFGRRVYRRPLTNEEIERWISVAAETSEGDPKRGLESVVAGLLQSPHFLYRIELGEVMPTDPGKRRYTAYEMASRLSFLILNRAPDDALLDAAERGELLDDISLREHVENLLNTDAARSAVQDFFSQYLDLKRLNEVDRDPQRYPGYTEALLPAMKTEIRLLVDDAVFRRRSDIRGLFFERRAYVNSALAALYELDAPGSSLNAFVPVEYGPDVPRAGILTLGAFLTMNAHPTETSPTLRGKYVRERILCELVPAPPDDIDINLDDEVGGPATLRERLEQHRSDPACAGCHQYIDPPGYLFENYDSVGRYREEAEGHPIDATGDLDGMPLNHARDLAAKLSTIRVSLRVSSGKRIDMPWADSNQRMNRPPSWQHWSPR